LQYYAELQIRISIKDMGDRPAYSKSDHVILEPNSDYVAFFSSYDNNLKYEH